MDSNKQKFDDWGKPRDYMTGNPLNADQTVALAQYCANKKVTMFDFLFNEMGFVPVDNNGNVVFNTEVSDGVSSLVPKMANNNKAISDLYFAAGAQEPARYHQGREYGVSFNVIDALKTGAGNQTIKLVVSCLDEFGMLDFPTGMRGNVMFFQSR